MLGFARRATRPFWQQDVGGCLFLFSLVETSSRSGGLTEDRRREDKKIQKRVQAIFDVTSEFHP